MVTEPTFGLIKHLFDMEQLHLEWFVAAAIVTCTLLYLTRIIGISFSYGLAAQHAPPGDAVNPDSVEQQFEGPSLAN